MLLLVEFSLAWRGCGDNKSKEPGPRPLVDRRFLVQVNADHWKPSDDPSGCVCKEAANNMMNQIGQKDLSLSQECWTLCYAFLQ